MSEYIKGISLDNKNIVNIEVNGKRISKLTKDPISNNHRQDFDNTYIAPGLVDIQINGYKGIDFNSTTLTKEDVKDVCFYLLQNGVTSFMPTVITSDDDSIKYLLKTISDAYDAYEICRQSILGIHLEGPFISPLDGARGAHPKDHVCAPSWAKFNEYIRASKGLIKIVTISPEWDASYEFTKKCINSNIIVSIGHTMANTEQINRVTMAGAKLSTHLGNGAPTMIQRHPNFIWDQLANDNLTASFIGDGFHLPFNCIKVLLRSKNSNAILVSDCTHLSGCEPGEYTTHIGGKVVLMKNGKLATKENLNILAGSAMLQIQAIPKLVGAGLLTLEQIWKLASKKPAILLENNLIGQLETGSYADLVCFSLVDGSIKIKCVYKHGVKIY